MDEEDPIMISALQHYSYCPRQYALIHLEQEFSDNIHTNRGHAVHKTVDDPGTKDIKGIRVERALPLYSKKLGLIGKADVVEFYGNIPYPIEYKHGIKRIKLHDDIQLTAQALCLEEMTGISVSQGAIYHFRSRRRREVIFTDELKKKVVDIISEIKLIIKSQKLPIPVNDSRCTHCSLNEICQPNTVSEKQKLQSCYSNLFDISNSE